MELGAEEGLGLVANAFVSAVVHVGEERLPPLAKLGVVDGVAMVLGSDVALVRQAVNHRLWGRNRGYGKGIGGGRAERQQGWQGERRAEGREGRRKGTHIDRQVEGREPW